MPSALVHLASGIGNIVFATPLILALQEMDISVNLVLDADYPETAGLFEQWSAVATVRQRRAGEDLPFGGHEWMLPAIPPFYWRRFSTLYHRVHGKMARPPDRLFWENEQGYYLDFARRLGYHATRPLYPYLPIPPAADDCTGGVTARTVVLVPGCKSGEMARKRWPWFADLAAALPDVAIAGTADDLHHGDGAPWSFPSHARNLTGKFTLRQTAEVLAGAGLVIGNDAGLSHIAAAVGTPTILLFGPTPDRELGPMPPHVQVVRASLPCEPCWRGSRFAACEERIDCLKSLAVAKVLNLVLQRKEIFDGVLLSAG
jgi:ADP-heptose:LPS heptosyltransferase